MRLRTLKPNKPKNLIFILKNLRFLPALDSGELSHRRRLVINIGGAKIWVTDIGGRKNFWEIYFQTKNLLKKFPSILWKISDDLFLFCLVIDNFFYKNLHLSFKMYSVFFVLLSLFLLSFMFIFFNKQNSKILVWLLGGKKGALPPILIFLGGACPGCPPESTPMLITFGSYGFL